MVVEGLERAGTPRVFARAGTATAFIAAARRRGLDVVQTPSGTAACVMAAVTGTLDGVPGAVVIADDPTVARAGVDSAFLARAPLVVVTTGVDAGERAEGRGRLGAHGKASIDVAPGSAAHWIAHACQLAVTEPSGPVHLHVGEHVARAAALPVATTCRPAPLAPPDGRALDAAAHLLGGAARPLLIVGRQCRSESDAAWLRAFAEALPAPALVTPNAKGALPDPHPLVIGALAANARETELVHLADLIVTIGLDPLEVPPRAWPAQTPVLHLAAAAPEMGVTAAVVGDIGLILEELAPRLRGRRLADWDVARLHALKQAAGAPPADAQRLAGYRVVEAARRLTPAGAIAVLASGGAWAESARAWPVVARGEVVIEEAHASPGFALTGAAAAQLARPDRRVVCFTDAAALVAVHDELAMMVTLGLPVRIVVLGGPEAWEPPPGLDTFAASMASFASVFEAALAAAVPRLLRVQGGRADGAAPETTV